MGFIKKVPYEDITEHTASDCMKPALDTRRFVIPLLRFVETHLGVGTIWRCDVCGRYWQVKLVPNQIKPHRWWYHIEKPADDDV